jgi:hypothetical protein
MMLPRGVEGLLVAGRSASADHVAQSSIRKTTTCMTMGQAAGTAAALAVRRKVTPRQVPIGDLQVTLRAQGAILSADEAVEYA